MFSFIFSRLLSTLVVVVGVITLVFLLIHLVPGDPIQVMLGEMATKTDQAALRTQLGLDQPLMVQWVNYFWHLLQGDMGISIHSKKPVSDLLLSRIGPTMQLAIAGLTVAILIAIPLGCIAAMYQNTLADDAAMIFSLLGISIPHFWMGPLLIILFSLQLGWLPVSGNDSPLSIVLPALTLGTALAAILTRMVRATLLEVLHEDYIRTARAKGLTEIAIMMKHALRNAALPIITILGLQLGTVLGGAVITETLFAWPGLGQLTIEAIQTRDYPVVQACVLFISLTYVIVNRLTDIVYAWLDPRVRYRV